MRFRAPGIETSQRRGMTLVEMMVSLVCVILLMLAYTQLFSDVGSRVSDARSMIDLTNRMRSVEHRLRADLAGVTCDMTPWQRPEQGAGYFEILEGIASDSDPKASASSGWDNTHPVLGDYDDTLMFTVRSKDGPFTGRFVDPTTGQPTIVQSDVAEVFWFMRPTILLDSSNPSASSSRFTNPITYSLYRRVFLVMPTYQSKPVQLTSFDDVRYDLSCRKEGSTYIANTLGDLTKRECRTAHTYSANSPNSANGFPHEIIPASYLPFGGEFSGGNYVINPGNARFARYGEDVVLTNVVAFDVQVWDPTAPIYIAPNVSNPQVAVVPGDPGFPYPPGTAIPSNPAPVSMGAYVDLNWHNDAWNGQPVAAPWNSALTRSPFYSVGHPKSQLQANAATGRAALFDTWSYHYEHDGLDQDNLPNAAVRDTKYGPDQGTNGFDDDGNGIVDDIGERETSPPYPVPLRGIKIRIRCYEPDSRQVHEISVVHSFVPE